MALGEEGVPDLLHAFDAQISDGSDALFASDQLIQSAEGLDPGAHEAVAGAGG